jgi:uncharacterized protein (TIGR02452 family)
MSLAHIGAQTLEITRRGFYTGRSGERVSIADAVARSIEGTRLYRPCDYELLDGPQIAARASTTVQTSERSGVPDARTTILEVTPESTAQAARRLVGQGHGRALALNFASAKNPGGGFLRGAKAQEEDLARCSALYVCQLEQPAYYAANRACGSMLYTDHLIYSPDVPFFRDERLELLDVPFSVSIITSPAPNAGNAGPCGEGPLVRATLERRAEQILRVAAHHGHDVLVLGAWGCGVFRNDPDHVADVFARLLTDGSLASAFSRVVFAIYDRSKTGATLRAFQRRMPAGPPSLFGSALSER